MYYLRKEPHEAIMQAIEKTDGTVIPERKYMSEDRALYKANGLSRFYRRDYTGDKQPGFSLYEVKKLSTIMRQRQTLYDYCGELFDVYDETGKVPLNG